ncbi:bromodomain-containing factor 1-like isoform X2 [Cucumis melo var. makuwa]|uniref:Bromodomain-containing factor 1-like isoform X2 n=1 Tax=Cucumis melo var. makuwa TaxID=1194695 RepID=A0A5D3BP34_CUCMM|nr:bromodomain-containing factor 1-like isoform X2 [Cucumis melo var. makuwa]TYK01531.1 bromodomain-containing factor 1-like isoform X2 [Cucumis melo var. makuwa]
MVYLCLEPISDYTCGLLIYLSVVVKSYASQVIDGTLDMNDDDIFVQICGPEKHRHVRGYGVGVIHSELFGSSSKVHDLERRLNESKKISSRI